MLLSYDDADIDLPNSQKDSVINALGCIRIIDPACGSGAFPMGILQKILLVLQKLDHNSKKWLDKLLSRVPDPMYQKELKRKVDQPNYLHKLGIIKDCIFGVDIQPTAVEISKLRCFLSLIVDEKVDDSKPNRGVEPLPNLEFKFVCANTLIGLPKAEVAESKKSQSRYGPKEYKGQSLMLEAADEIKELKKLRDEYLRSYGKEKKNIEKRFAEIQSKLRKHTLQWSKADTQTAKLADWEPFCHKSCSWFDPEWMFGVKDSFDIVIANPPYRQLSKDKSVARSYRQYLRAQYKTSGGRLNTFIFFIHRGYDLLNIEGTLAYIIPNTILTQEYYNYTRKFLLDRAVLLQIITYPTMQFEHAVVENVTLLCQKKIEEDYEVHVCQQDDFRVKGLVKKSKKSFLAEPNYNFNVNVDLVTDKVFSCPHVELDSLCHINQAIALKGDKSASLRYENKEGEYVRLLDGRNINKYLIQWGGVYLDYDIERIHSCKRRDIFESSEKLFFRRISTNLIFAYDDEQFYALNTLVVVNLKRGAPVTLKYLLAMLNSNLMDYVYRTKFKSTKRVFSEIQARSVARLPVILPNDDVDASFSRIVNRILTCTKNGDYSKSLRKQEEVKEAEQEIDQMVYALYGLTEEEIAIVEGVRN